MKNKGMSPIIATLIIILLMIVALGIIWVVVKNVIEGEPPQFKITKKECELIQTQNVSWNINNYYASKVLGLKEYDLHFLLNGEEDIECDEHICKVTARYFYEVCEQVEVNLREDPCIEEIDNECWGDVISVNWLEENCECISQLKLNCEEDCQNYKCGDYTVVVK